MAKRAPPCALQPEGRPPLPCVTVTLHPFFSGQTEKPGELRADGDQRQHSDLQGEPSIPPAPSGTEGETAGRKKGDGLPSPLAASGPKANSQAVEKRLGFLVGQVGYQGLLRPFANLLTVAPGAGEHRRTILEALDTLLK